jgi:hypothetical protein
MVRLVGCFVEIQCDAFIGANYLHDSPRRDGELSDLCLNVNFDCSGSRKGIFFSGEERAREAGGQGGLKADSNSDGAPQRCEVCISTL